ncbi:hypothetical protein CR203_06255 [Salipaludibacillus neizhouensis]|uniref:DUF4829 domain-containing protein n=1 Tax=Salipaludibacillus neizhouensis TaxID=885475 RepID=A0A3A9K4W1_9BACI|nr:hypothetical protein [Salipaludibacillus neizhouensis]RKL68094.1 hypothetical protein CR203_06255 [Salipaludibacillus neizhouensis]
MKSRGRQRQQTTPILIAGSAVLLIILLLITFISSSPEEKVVKEFYEYEQKQEFWNSYELFHPHMKKRFSRSKYIDQRAHIFVDHFDVDTYDLTIGSSKKIKEWQMSDDHQPLSNVYQIPVTKTYQSQFGKFSILQNVYAVKEEGEWHIMWDYHY